MSPVKAASEPERFDMSDDVFGKFESAATKPADNVLLQLLPDQAASMQRMQEELRELREERSAEAQWWYDEQVQASQQPQLQTQWAGDVSEEFANEAEVLEAARESVQQGDVRIPTVQGLARALGLQSGMDAMAKQTSGQDVTRARTCTSRCHSSRRHEREDSGHQAHKLVVP